MRQGLQAPGDMRDDLENLGLNIVKGFHEQFAQNQNHHQGLFLQVLTVLLTVLVGFGYVYIRVQSSAPKGELNITILTLHEFLALATLLLTLGIALICNMALGFRRDQMVAANIRMLAGVMKQDGESLEPLVGNSVDFFPSAFNPVRNTGPWEWIPEFHRIFVIALLSVEILLRFSVLGNPDFASLAVANPKGKAFIETLDSIGYGLIWVGGAIFLLYWWKWVGTAVNGFPRLQLKEDKFREFMVGIREEYRYFKNR